MTPLRRIQIGLAVLAGVIVAGTLGYMVLGDVRLFDALYMVVITVTTVGFSEVFELSDVTRAWTLGILVVGFGVTLYTAIASIEYLIDLDEFRRRRRMRKHVSELRDHVIVCGFGRVGRGTFHALENRRAAAVVIDSDAERVESARSAGALVIHGDATHNDILHLAGIDHAQSIIACVADDSDNLVIALSAKALRPDVRVVSRATEPESDRKLRLAGADAVVTPQAVGAERLAVMALQPELAQIFDVVVDGSPLEFRVEELDIDADCRVVGKTLRDSEIRQSSGATVLAVEGHGHRLVVNPPPEFTLSVGDRLVVVGTKEQVKRAADHLKVHV
ncbi:MAG: potassium channel protein [Acidimicrobiia bacterium]|nr:potassium channel protein [Acidimicrobiia bacterium]